MKSVLSILVITCIPVFAEDVDSASYKDGWTIVRSGGVTGTTSGKYSGRIRSLKIYNVGQGAEPENALYFNKFRVIPASE